MIPRRVFLKDGGLALLSVGVAPRFLLRTAAAGRGRRKVLVVIFQRGAVDGLNMVIPFAERDYYFARPSIALARPGAGEGAALDLDGFFGLHPRLGPLHRLYRRGHLAIVHACGSPNSTRSHFDAQDYMETGTPGVKRTGDGWLNRYLGAGPQSQDGTPFRGVAMTEMLPRSLLGAVPTLAIPDLRRFGIRGGGAAGEPGAFRSALEAEYAAASDPRLNTAGRDAFEAIRMLESVRPGAEPANGAVYPTSAYGRTLGQIAQLIKADVGLEVAFAELTGWDHHVNEGAATGQLAGRLDDFARGIAALVTDLGDRMEDVLVLTMSEFGRAVAENGSRGTDHGHGNAMFLVGGTVNGGQVYGQWPGLTAEQRFEGRDLAVSTDFRDVFAEVLVRHLGLGVEEARGIFPGHQMTGVDFLGLL